MRIDCGGPTLKINVLGNLLPFELHPWCGPHPLHKITGDPLSKIPPGFWEAIDLWVRGGKKLSGDECLVPCQCRECDGMGYRRRHLGGKHYKVTGECKACSGSGVVFP